MSLYVDKQYTSKKDTPLAWHNYSRYVRAPLGIIVSLGSWSSLSEKISNDGISGIIAITYLIYVVLLLIYTIGSFSWKRSAWLAIIIVQFYGVFNTLCCYTITSGISNAIVFTLFRSIIAYAEFVYFKKRELLFDGKKYDEPTEDIYIMNDGTRVTIKNNVEEETINVNHIFTDDSYVKTRYCRKCGAELYDDSKFCRKCGTKVEE